MPVIGVGTDLVEVARIEAFAQKPGALARIFSPEEIDYCLSRKNKYEHLAVRFAAKEAVFKALPFDGVAFRNITVVNLENGRPQILIKDSRAKGFTIFISLSHTHRYATAQVVIETCN